MIIHSYFNIYTYFKIFIFGVEGACVSGACVCDAGYAGESCEETSVISPGETVTGEITEQYAWDYYSFEVAEEGTHLILEVEDDTSNGDIDVYVRKNKLPLLNQYNYANYTNEVRGKKKKNEIKK